MPQTVHRIEAAAVFPEKEFPLSVHMVPHHGPTRLHQHKFHELVIILAGRGRHVTGKESYAIEAGDVFLIRRDMSHGYADTNEMTLVNILFHPRRLQIPLANLGDVPGYHALFRIEPQWRPQDRLRGRLRLTSDELGEAAQIIARLRIELSRKGPGYRFLACAHLMNLIGYLSRCYTRVRAPAGRSIMRLGEVLSYLEKHYSEPVRVVQLARMAHMSESSLMRTFKQIVGRSPIDHLIRLRIARASELLRGDDIRVTEVALQCGFNDSNYFSRQFRKVTGRSPRQFKRLPGEPRL